MAAITFIVFAIIIVGMFSVQNAALVSVSFLSMHFDASLALVALLFFMAGVIAGMALLSWIRLQQPARKKNEQDERRSNERPI